MATHSSIIAWRIPWTEEADSLREESDTTERLTLSLFMLERFDAITLPPCGLLVSRIVLCRWQWQKINNSSTQQKDQINSEDKAEKENKHLLIIMPKNVQSIIQLCSFHMLVRLCSKSFKLGFSSMWTENFQMYKLGFKEAEKPYQIAYVRWIIQKTREFQNNIYFRFIDYAINPFTMWITKN